MAQVSKNVGITFNITIEVDDENDDDAVEDAVAEKAVEVFKEQYGIDVRLKDIVILD